MRTIEATYCHRMDATATLSDEENMQHLSTSAIVCSQLLLSFKAVEAATHDASLLIHELDDESIGDHSVNPNVPKLIRLHHLRQGHISLFKVNTGFFSSEFEKLCQLVCPSVIQRARHTNDDRQAAGRPTKLDPQGRLLACILYLRHINGVRQEAASWNVSRTPLRDDAVFLCSIVNDVLAHETSWPDVSRRQQLRGRIPKFAGCIGFIDGTLCRIRRPRCSEHKAYFNGRNKSYCFNSKVVNDHDGLFIFVEPGYAGSFQDVRILRAADLARNWRNYFTTDDDSPHPIEYLLRDPGYLRMEHFILRRVDGR